ncbi:OmpA family protein [Enterobacteriaceae endosymbiont of Donacia bicoloricornis]|uniref:outer membrane beta-barrel protein n=1 Tax=Enterobacteriaceae endosymbiont of Donacia bicoloricornis TaxID=2675772 RepID=UPI00144A1AD6|nr:outer membrane beta-barrel protein [Enterobacteriaceae endosymbiont of Donacia bicoloricornis]QJC37712.1 OmpA family protein [Enterobacteriaceae endosymbiont of Donacia bicoloricornis]
MKKITIIFIMIIMNIYNIANAGSNFKEYWYFGSKFGLSQYDNIKLLGKDIDNKKYTVFNKIGNGLFVGYQSNNFFGFEMGFDWLGIVKKNIEDKGTTNFFESKGVQLTSNFRYPIFKNVYLYSRLGGLFTQSINQQSDKNNGNRNINNKYYSISPVIVLGGEYIINNNLSSRIEYQFSSNIGNKYDDDLGQRTNNSMLTLNLVYKFTDKYHVPSIKSFIKKVKNNHYNNYGNGHVLSKTKVYFNSNKSVLGKQNKKKLNKILDINIKNKNLSKNNDNQIVIIGHSDYLEKDNDNILSEKRVKQVIKHLKSKNKNLFKKIIIKKGLGSSLLINKNCQKIKNRKLLKRCLVIDRYVEIKILKVCKKTKKRNNFYKNHYFIDDNNRNYEYNYCLKHGLHNCKNKFFIYNLLLKNKLLKIYQLKKKLYSISNFLYKI